MKNNIKNKRPQGILDANPKILTIGLLSYPKLPTFLHVGNIYKIFNIFLAVLLISMFTFPVSGQVMESSNYKLQSDSVNVGGLRSTSTNYRQESTVGEVATGLSDSTNYKLKAGYQQMQEVFIAITSISDVTMSPSIDGVAGGTGNGSTQFDIKTDNSAGFSATIKSESDVGMVGETQGGNILHLVTATTEVPDFTFDSAPANSSAFAYTVNASSSDDLVQLFKDNGSACNVDSNQAEERCWIAATTSTRTILSSTSRTPISGSTSTLRFRAIIAASPVPAIPADTYTSTTTITAVAL